METQIKDFWDRVNFLIKSQNTKQETICNSCGINYQTFRGWIVHQKYPNAYQCYKLALALQTSVEFLLTGEPSKNPTDNSTNIKLLQQIIDNSQQVIKNMEH